MRHHYRSFPLAGWFVLCFVHVAFSATWDIEPIQTTGDIGWNVNAALSSTGALHTSYYKSGGGTGYAYREDSSWVVGAGISGGSNDLALDNNGIPHVLVRQYDGDAHLRLAKLNASGTWDLTTCVTGNLSQMAALSFDTLNRPHIGYIDTTSRSLMYSVKNGDSWQTQTVVSGDDFQYTNSSALMALNSTGQAEFIYGDSSTGYSYHTAWDGSSWVRQPIAQGSFGSMVFDSSDHLHTAYKALSGEQMYGKYDGTTWTMSVVESKGDARSDICLDPWQRPHIVYGIDRGAGSSRDKLKHAYYTGSSWTSEIISYWPSPANGAEDQAIAIDNLGNIHVVFSNDDQNFYSASLEAPSEFQFSSTFDARASSTDGVNFQAVDGDETIVVQRVPFSDTYRRGILEFDIGDLPPTAAVSSATLELDITGYTYDSDGFPVLSLYGYSGDGALSDDDALHLTDLIGQVKINELGIVTINLDTEFMESLLGNTSYLGIVAYGDPDYRQVSFAAMESSFFSPAKLNIVMAVPEPATFSLLIAGIPTLIRRRRNRYRGFVSLTPI